MCETLESPQYFKSYRATLWMSYNQAKKNMQFSSCSPEKRKSWWRI